MISTHFTFAATSIGLALVFGMSAVAETRSWTDTQGRKVEAEYGGVEGGKVILKLAGGKIVPFPFTQLSAVDQAYVKRQYGISPANAAKQIDAFVNAKLLKEGIKPNPMTTDEEFVRRAYLEIAGTIPTFDQTLDFLESTDKSKRRQLIDRLLSSEEFVSHSFNWYADMLRLVSITNDFFIYETYIEWVKGSIRENKPYDRFVYELLTATGRMWDDPAAGYVIRDRGMPLDNLSITVSLFLSTEITCAQCHDHPFEDWTQKDFYGLAAFLGQRQDTMYGREFGTMMMAERNRIESEQRAVNPALGPSGFVQPFRNVVGANNTQVWDDTSKQVTLPHDYKYDDGKPNELVKPQVLFGNDVDLKNFASPRVAFASWLTSKDNRMFGLSASNRLWKRAFGLGLHEPLDNIHSAKDAGNPELLSYLEQYLKDAGFNTKEVLRAIYYSEAWQRRATLDGPTQAQISANQYHFPGPVVKRMSAEQLWDSFLTLTTPAPLRYKRDVAADLTESIRFDIKGISGAESIERTNKLQDLIRKTIGNSAPSLSAWKQEGSAVDESGGQLVKFAGAYLTRASEQVQPAPLSHFLNAWGQSDRLLVDNSSVDGSIPQILTMLNGAFPDMLIKQDSLIFKTTGSQRGSRDKMENIYLSILNRYPKGKEKGVAARAIQGGDQGYGDLIWALVNTREFIFIK